MTNEIFQTNYLLVSTIVYNLCSTLKLRFIYFNYSLVLFYLFIFFFFVLLVVSAFFLPILPPQAHLSFGIVNKNMFLFLYPSSVNPLSIMHAGHCSVWHISCLLASMVRSLYLSFVFLKYFKLTL